MFQYSILFTSFLVCKGNGAAQGGLTGIKCLGLLSFGDDGMDVACVTFMKYILLNHYRIRAYLMICSLSLSLALSVCV